jgi:arsenate reductase-like glutaredoxin family protein
MWLEYYKEKLTMNVQIYGAAKCFDTKKAVRYFKERNIKYQYIDLSKYGLSKGEFASVKAAVGLNNLFNQKAKEYKQLNLDHIKGSGVREEILSNNPKLYKSPIVRNGKQATVGYQPEVWQDWE